MKSEKTKAVVNLVRGGARRAILASKKHAPTICAVAAVGGVILTAFSAARAMKEHEEVVETFTEETETTEKIVKLAPVWSKTGIVAAGTIAFIIAGNKISADRLAELGAALALTQKDNEFWKKKVKDISQEEEFSNYQEEEAQFVIDNASKDIFTNAIHTGHGNELFYDSFRGIAFYSSRQHVADVVNKLNARLTGTSYAFVEEVSANTLHDEWGTGSFGAGSILGWVSANNQMIVIPGKDGLPGIPGTHAGQLCWVLDYEAYLL